MNCTGFFLSSTIAVGTRNITGIVPTIGIMGHSVTRLNGSETVHCIGGYRPSVLYDRTVQFTAFDLRIS